MARTDGNDELLELLDSFDIDDEYNALSDKMDAFTREKKKKEVVEEEPADKEEVVEEQAETVESENVGNTIVGPLQSAESSDAGGKTLVFSKGVTPVPQPTGDTVVIDDVEIRSLNAEDTEEILRRQVIQEFNDQPMLSVELKRILFIVAGICVAFALLFGGYKLVSNLMGNGGGKEVDELRQSYFEEIEEWAERYDTMSEEEKEKIEELEAKFNKLNDEQKGKINQILIEKTGHNFDELLAQAKSYVAKEKKNNNTELAEKKAEIKAQIEALEAEMESIKGGMDQAEDVKYQAEQDWKDAQQLMTDAQDDVNNALAELNELEKDQWLTIEAKEEKYESVDEFNIKLIGAKENYLKKTQEYDFTSLQINVNNAYSEYNKATEEFNRVQGEYRERVQQVQELRNQLNSLERQ